MDDADVAAEDTGRRRVDLSDGEVDTRELGRAEDGQRSGLRQDRADLQREVLARSAAVAASSTELAVVSIAALAPGATPEERR